MRQAFTYKIIWNGQKRDYLYYTNITYDIFLLSVLGSLRVSASEKDNYEVFLNNELLPNTFEFPYTGVNGEVSIKKKTGRCIVSKLLKSSKGDTKQEYFQWELYFLTTLRYKE